MSESCNDSTMVVTGTDARARQGRLADILDHYLSELERGVPPRVETLVEENPDLADELRDYVESLHLLHGMTAGMRRSPAQPSPVADTARKQLGDYEIIRELGRGGMGIVYEARQMSLNRRVALKVLPFAAVLDDKQLARFRNEAQAAAQLHHPHIVPVLDQHRRNRKPCNGLSVGVLNRHLIIQSPIKSWEQAALAQLFSPWIDQESRVRKWSAITHTPEAQS